MDASHADKNTAYAAVNRIRLDDLRPHILRTHDGGKTWQEIVNGLPADPINVVKEDPKCKGLLFAGSERAVYVSFDDGENWQSLRMNMPATSIRDLVIKDNDLVVATHGRSFWIMDDMTSLRQIAKATVKHTVVLYQPANAYRIRWNMNPDTPLPPDEPAGENPPDGAIIEYYLKEKSNEEVTLDICNESGETIRHYSSKDTLYAIPEVNIPLYWVRPQRILSVEAGAHRFLWDMHYQPLNVPPAYSIGAIYENTAPEATSPWVMPGRYTAKLSVNGKVVTQSFEVLMDPRVKTSVKYLQLQHDLSYECYKDQGQTLVTISKLMAISARLADQQNISDNNLINKMATVVARSNELLTRHGGTATTSFLSLNAALGSAFTHIESSDWPPTPKYIDDAKAAHAAFLDMWKEWQRVEKEVADLDALIKSSKAGQKR